MFWLLMIGVLAGAATPKDARALFARHNELSQAYDPTVADLFSDDAGFVVVRDGETLDMSIDQFRAVVVDTMETAEQTGDRSTFKRVKVKRDGTGFVITARRYSHLKCYTDRDFSMRVEERDGELRIVRYATSTVGLPQCPPSEELASALANVAAGVAKLLPMDLDEETRLERIEVDGASLVYYQRLINVAPEEITEETLNQLLGRAVYEAACRDRTMRPLVDQGATIRYRYGYADDSKAALFDMHRGVCLQIESMIAKAQTRTDAPPPAPDTEPATPAGDPPGADPNADEPAE